MGKFGSASKLICWTTWGVSQLDRTLGPGLTTRTAAAWHRLHWAELRRVEAAKSGALSGSPTVATWADRLLLAAKSLVPRRKFNSLGLWRCSFCGYFLDFFTEKSACNLDNLMAHLAHGHPFEARPSAAVVAAATIAKVSWPDTAHVYGIYTDAPKHNRREKETQLLRSGDVFDATTNQMLFSKVCWPLPFPKRHRGQSWYTTLAWWVCSSLSENRGFTGVTNQIVDTQLSFIAKLQMVPHALTRLTQTSDASGGP